MRRSLLTLGILLVSITHISAWGFVAHRIVAENAAAAMPSGMAVFYQASAAAISDASIEPDSLLKGLGGESEKRSHYIDLDELSRPPFRDLPAEEQKARALYGSQRVDEAGTLPWRIVEVYGQLREAFRGSDWQKVISRSAWLSHYVSDAYQPLHTTKNHDGQESCNDGVHAAFETDMIDRKKARYRLETAPPEPFAAEAIRDPGRLIMAEIIRSYALVDDILKADSEAMRAVKSQRKDYYEEMERRAGALARGQLARATVTVANLWYSAWVEAGRPELPLPPTRRPGKARAGRP